MPLALILEPFKAGGSFDYDGEIELPDGSWTAECQLRDKKTGALVADLKVEIGDPQDGVSTISVSSESKNTKTWINSGKYRNCVLDIKVKNAFGLVSYTPTIEVRIISPITSA